MKRGIVILFFMLIIFSGIVFAACTDSDNGIDIRRLGVTTNDVYSYVDSCDDDTHANDAICVGEDIVVQNRLECRVGYSCHNGRCLNDLGAEAACEDSDGGVSYETYGIVTQGKNIILRDWCNGESSTLTEYYCEGGIIESINYRCTNGCSSGKCNPPLIVINPQLPEAGPGPGPRPQLPEAMPPPEARPRVCDVDIIFWSDGYDNNLQEAGIGLSVYGVVSGLNCEDAHVDLEIVNVGGDSLVGTADDFVVANDDQQEFFYDDATSRWYAGSLWTPAEEGYYYIHAIVHEAIPNIGFYYVNSNQLHVSSSCVPDLLPLGIACGNDPVTGEPLPSGNDFDCDGVDDCADQWIYNYGGDIDPATGVPVGMNGCLSEWDCTNAPWSSCNRNAEGRLTRTRNINNCFLPAGMSCPIAPTDERSCLQLENFPVFGWLNVLLVSMLMIGYYFKTKL